MKENANMYFSFVKYVPSIWAWKWVWNWISINSIWNPSWTCEPNPNPEDLNHLKKMGFNSKSNLKIICCYNIDIGNNGNPFLWRIISTKMFNTCILILYFFVCAICLQAQKTWFQWKTSGIHSPCIQYKLHEICT